MKAPVKLRRKKGKLARKLVTFGDQNAGTECHRQFLCVQKNTDQKRLSEVNDDFPSHLWDLLVSQAEMNQNLLRPCTSDPTISTWENFNGKLDYNATPLEPMGIGILIHYTTNHPEKIMGHELIREMNK